MVAGSLPMTLNSSLTSQKCERKWLSTKLDKWLVWLEHFEMLKTALRNAIAAYYSTFIEENKNNPRFLFSTVVRLTLTLTLNPFIPLTLSSKDCMGVFYDNILLLTSDGTNLASNKET